MVSESNTNRRHLKISNTYDQIHYNTDLYAYKSVITITTLQNQGGIFKRVVYQMGPDMGSNTFVFESI